MRYFPSRLLNLLHRARPKQSPEPHAVVPASEINYSLAQDTLPTRLNWFDEPQIWAGDWDRKKQCFDSSLVFRAFLEHFIEHIPWEETKYYAKVTLGYRGERVKKRGGSDQFFANYDHLYSLIQQHGFQGLPPLAIAIGRHGELIRWDGAHRLAIAKLLSIEEIPIRLVLIHPEAIAFTESLGIDLSQSMQHRAQSTSTP